MYKASSILPVPFRQVGLVLMIPAALFAQPFIDTVSSTGGLARGGLAQVYGGFFDRTATVRVGGIPAAVLGYQVFYPNEGGERGLQIQLPVELPPGPTTLVITTGGATSDAFPIMIEPYAPDLVGRGTAPVALAGPFAAVRFDRALPSGGFGPPYCSTGQPPKAGELVRVYAAGLGATDTPIATGTPAPVSPLANTLSTPTILVGGRTAEVIESVLAPGEIGVYRVTFRIPDPAGEGWPDITLGIGGKSSSQASLFYAIGPAHAASAESIQTAPSCASLAVGLILIGDPKSPPTNLGGVTVTVKDGQGVGRPAPLLSAAPDQVEYMVAAGTAGGADVTITSPGGAGSGGNLVILPVAPRVFTVAPNAIPAALIVRVRDGVQTVGPVFQADTAGGYQAVPIDLGPATDQLHLVVFGTGWRNRRSAPVDPDSYNAHVIFQDAPGADTIAAVSADYAGPQGELAGVDQMNVRLPRSLAGHRQVFAFLSVDDQWTSIFAKLSFK
jgi:uncharacterized protein (TIGR03437 family)